MSASRLDATWLDCGGSDITFASSLSLQMENLNVTEFEDGVVKCPFHPQANSTSLLQANGNMFVGSATDFSGSDVAIIRTPVQSNGVSHISSSLSGIHSCCFSRYFRWIASGFCALSSTTTTG